MRVLLIITALIFGLASLVRHFPLAWAVSSLPPSIGIPSGTIWNGGMANVPLLQTVSVQGGPGHVTLKTPPGEVTLSGRVGLNRVDDLIVSMPVSQLPMSDTRLSGLSGQLSLRIDEAIIEKAACVSASGQASTNLLAVNEATFDWAGPVLSGPVDCTEGRLRVRLSGQSGVETVQAEIRTGLDGVYQAELTVVTSDPSAANALTLFGFNPTGNSSYRLLEQGRWR